MPAAKETGAVGALFSPAQLFFRRSTMAVAGRGASRQAVRHGQGGGQAFGKGRGFLTSPGINRCEWRSISQSDVDTWILPGFCHPRFKRTRSGRTS